MKMKVHAMPGQTMATMAVVVWLEVSYSRHEGIGRARQSAGPAVSYPFVFRWTIRLHLAPSVAMTGFSWRLVVACFGQEGTGIDHEVWLPQLSQLWPRSYFGRD